MPITVKPLTATQVKNAKPKTKLYTLSDGGGLSLWVYPTGNKNWVMRIQKNGKRQDIRKPFAELSLSEARVWREEVRTRVAKGEIIEGKVDTNFQAVFYEWLERWSKRVGVDTATRMRSCVDKYVMPKLGHLDVAQIRPVDIVNSLKEMEDKGILQSLKKAKSGVRQSLDYAVARGLVDMNPAASVTAKAFEKPDSKHFRSLLPDELPTLIAGIERGFRQGKVKPITYYLVYWQLLTWARPGQAAMTEWSEINLDEKLWVVPADKMKKRREFIVPLTNLMVDVLLRAKELNIKGKYVFEGRAGGHVSKDTVRMLMNRLEINTTAHGFRSLARTTLGDIMREDGEGLKYDKETLNRCLSHKVDTDTDTAYDKSKHIAERRPILAEWSEIVAVERSKYAGL